MAPSTRLEIDTTTGSEEKQPLANVGSLEASVPVTHLLTNLNLNQKSDHKDDPDDDNDMSSIGGASPTGELGDSSDGNPTSRQSGGGRSSEELKKSVILSSTSVAGISTLGSKSATGPTPATPTCVPFPVPTNKVDLKRWLSRKDILTLIVLIGLVSQIWSGNTQPKLAKTYEILIRMSQPAVLDEPGGDLALSKFHDKFATPVLTHGAQQLRTTFHMMHSYSQMILKMSHHTHQVWPFVHIPEFNQRTEALLNHHQGTGTLIIKNVALAPLVTSQEMGAFALFQESHRHNYPHHGAKQSFPSQPRASRQLTNNGGRLEYHPFVPLQNYQQASTPHGPNDTTTNTSGVQEWFQIAHIQAALNTIQKTEAPVLLLGRNLQKNSRDTPSSDYILQPILDQVLVKKRLFRTNVYEKQVVAVLAAQVQFVEAVQLSTQQHFPALELRTDVEEAKSVLVLLKDTCNLQVSYKVVHQHAGTQVPSTTSGVQFLGVGTYHKDDWGVASRQVHWTDWSAQSDNRETTSGKANGGSGGHSTGTPFCFPDGIRISLYPTPELHKALSHHFDSKIYVVGLFSATIAYTLLLVMFQGFLGVLVISGIANLLVVCWRKLCALLDEPDMETMLTRAIVEEINDHMSKKDCKRANGQFDPAVTQCRSPFSTKMN